MCTQTLEVKTGRRCQTNERIVFDINEIPYQVALYIQSNNEVILNSLAYRALGMKENEVFDIATWRRINPYFDDEVNRLINENAIIDQKIHVVLFNGKHEIMNYSLKRIYSAQFGRITFIYFCKASEKYSVASIASLYSIKDEVAKLRPYLNRAGKVMHEATMKKYFREDVNQKLTLNDLVYYEKELRIIQKAFPLLSFREVILCGLLVNNIDSQDIASITNRTIDAVFVTIHRINRKLNMVNKKQLVDTLKELINKERQTQIANQESSNLMDYTR